MTVKSMVVMPRVASRPLDFRSASRRPAVDEQGLPGGRDDSASTPGADVDEKNPRLTA